MHGRECSSEWYVQEADANLLVGLDAICRSGLVPKASEAPSQSALTHAFDRQRDLTCNPLVPRRGRGLVPTPRALGLADKLAGSVAVVRACLRPEGFGPEPDAAVSHRGQRLYRQRAVAPVGGRAAAAGNRRTRQGVGRWS